MKNAQDLTTSNSLADLAALTRYYDAACRALAQARSVDEVKDIRDISIAMRAYARQANNHDLEADAVEIRMKATRGLDQMRRAQKEAIGLASGKEGKRKALGLPKNPSDRTTLAEAGIDKNLAHEARKLGALSDHEFEQTVAEVRDAITSAVGKVVKSITLPNKKEIAAFAGDSISLTTWRTLSEDERRHYLDPRNFPSNSQFTREETDSIEWAQSSWNPITGCLHDCPYCYCPDLVARFPGLYPDGFAPALRPFRLQAPRNTRVPDQGKIDERYKNVFLCSMADLFGRWVFSEWIELVLSIAGDNPQWNFLCLTKSPKRIAEFDIPKNAWMGTTVDLQARVANAEEAFARLADAGVGGYRWLSVEPMLEPLKFQRLDLFHLIVIGGASRTSKTPEFPPPTSWWVDLYLAAKAAGCAVYMKKNLFGNRVLELPFNAPVKPDFPQVAPDVFHYLGKRKAEREP